MTNPGKDQARVLRGPCHPVGKAGYPFRSTASPSLEKDGISLWTTRGIAAIHSPVPSAGGWFRYPNH
jgi:hypothetical protein